MCSTINSVCVRMDIDQPTEDEQKIATIKDIFFFDVQILCPDITLPAHKYVLAAKSNVLCVELSSGINELDWTDYEDNICIALLQWFYTDKIDFDSTSATVALGLLSASHRFHLPNLFNDCERKLMNCVNETSCNDMYLVAEDVGAKLLSKKCLQTSTDLDSLYFESSWETPEGSYKAVAGKLLRETALIRREIGLEVLINGMREKMAEQRKIQKILDGIKWYLTFSDAEVWLNHGEIGYWPGHSHVISGRSQVFREKSIDDKIYLPHLPQDSERALLRWLYTDTIILDSDTLAVDLLTASHEFKLSSLFKQCEQALVKTVKLSTCTKMYSIAKRLGAMDLSKSCTQLASTYWKVFDLQDLSELPKMIIASETPLLQSQNVITTQPCKIFNLNDDCLLDIFKYASMLDLGNLKNTCQRFSILADQSFQTYRQKSFLIKSSTLIADIWNLENFCKFISSIELDVDEPYDIVEDIFKVIAKLCNANLKKISLKLHYYGFKDESLESLKEIMKNVEIVKLTDVGDIDLLLSYCENLKEVHLHGEEMIVDTLWCEKNPNVKRITMDHMHDDSILVELPEKLLYLEYVSFSCANTNISKIHHLSQLNHLKELKIDVFDDPISLLLQNLAKKNLLESLWLSWLDLDAIIARTLSDFTKMKELTLCEIRSSLKQNVLDIFSMSRMNIKKLCFIDCSYITLADIIQIIANHKKLEQLVISGCNEIACIDKKSYFNLTKLRKNIRISLDDSVYQATIELIASDSSKFVRITRNNLANKRI